MCVGVEPMDGSIQLSFTALLVDVAVWHNAGGYCRRAVDFSIKDDSPTDEGMSSAGCRWRCVFLYARCAACVTQGPHVAMMRWPLDGRSQHVFLWVA